MWGDARWTQRPGGSGIVPAVTATSPSCSACGSRPPECGGVRTGLPGDWNRDRPSEGSGGPRAHQGGTWLQCFLLHSRRFLRARLSVAAHCKPPRLEALPGRSLPAPRPTGFRVLVTAEATPLSVSLALVLRSRSSVSERDAPASGAALAAGTVLRAERSSLRGDGGAPPPVGADPRLAPELGGARRPWRAAVAVTGPGALPWGRLSSTVPVPSSNNAPGAHSARLVAVPVLRDTHRFSCPSRPVVRVRGTGSAVLRAHAGRPGFGSWGQGCAQALWGRVHPAGSGGVWALGVTAGSGWGARHLNSICRHVCRRWGPSAEQTCGWFVDVAERGWCGHVGRWPRASVKSGHGGEAGSGKQIFLFTCIY